MNIRKKISDRILKLRSTGFFHIFISTVINKILGFLSNVFIVRFISKTEYGIYSSALNILSFFIIITGLGTLSGVLQLCSENVSNEKKRVSIYAYGSFIGIIFNAVLGIIILLSALFVSFPVEGTNSILLMLSFIPLIEIICEFQKIFFRSKLDNKAYAFSNTLNTVFITSFSLAGSYFFKVNGLIVGRYLAAAASILINLILLKAPVFIKTKKPEKELRSVFYKISLISMFNNGLSQILYLGDILLIGIVIADPKIVADYKVAITIPNALLFIPAAVCIYIYPYFSSHKDNGVWLRKTFRVLMFYSIIINFIISALLIILSGQILKIFGEQYLKSAPIFIVSAIGYFFSASFRMISGNLLVTQRKLKFNLLVSLVSGILNLLGNYISILYIGAIGAAWTTLAVSAASGLVCTAYFTKIIISKPEGS